MSATPARDAYRAALARGADLYWWHAAVCDELDRIGGITIAADGQAAPVYSAAGIAGNVRGFLHSDTVTYCRQLIAAGVLEETAPRWDFADLWVGPAAEAATNAENVA